MSIQLYSWPRSTGSRVQWALEELGVAYEYVTLDPAKGEHKASAYAAINPTGKVPALVDGGVSYFESLAIMLHLGERYGVERGLWPGGGQERVDAVSWTVWSITELYRHLFDYLYHGLDTPISYKPEDRSKASAEWNLASLTRDLDMIEKRLGDREYICGAFSLVDVTAASVLRSGTGMGARLDAHPAVAAWLERCAKRPAVAKVQ